MRTIVSALALLALAAGAQAQVVYQQQTYVPCQPVVTYSTPTYSAPVYSAPVTYTMPTYTTGTVISSQPCGTVVSPVMTQPMTWTTVSQPQPYNPCLTYQIQQYPVTNIQTVQVKQEFVLVDAREFASLKQTVEELRQWKLNTARLAELPKDLATNTNADTFKKWKADTAKLARDKIDDKHLAKEKRVRPRESYASR